MKPFPLILPLAATFFTLSVTGMPPEDTRDERVGEYIDTEGQKTEVQYPRPIPEATRDEKEEERIIGGKEAEEGQFPFAVAIYYGDLFICTGSIIGPHTILTAAHCIFQNGIKQDGDIFHAIAHVNRSSPAVRINFLKVETHPEYTEENLDNDIAIFTSETIIFDGRVNHICIAGPNTYANKFKKAIVMGWGNTERDSESYPDNLRYVEQKIVANTLCRMFFTPGVNDKRICAKGFFNGICSGDSGGPLVQMSADKSKLIQFGIASYINAMYGCGHVVPAVFTKVSSFYDFIMQNSEDGICVE